jgi:hypothetical protein
VICSESVSLCVAHKDGCAPRLRASRTKLANRSSGPGLLLRRTCSAASAGPRQRNESSRECWRYPLALRKRHRMRPHLVQCQVGFGPGIASTRRAEASVRGGTHPCETALIRARRPSSVRGGTHPCEAALVRARRRSSVRGGARPHGHPCERALIRARGHSSVRDGTWRSPGFVDIPGSVVSAGGMIHGKTKATEVYSAIQG